MMLKEKMGADAHKAEIENLQSELERLRKQKARAEEENTRLGQELSQSKKKAYRQGDDMLDLEDEVAEEKRLRKLAEAKLATAERDILDLQAVIASLQDKLAELEG